MSKTLKIKNKSSFVKNFLSPISKISDASILEVNGSMLSCLTCTADNSVYYHVEYPIESDIVDIKTLNCPDIKKLIKNVCFLNKNHFFKHFFAILIKKPLYLIEKD